MAADARKRQKKQERRSRKRKEKKQVLVRRQSLGLAERLAAACQSPVLHCWITESLWEEGIGFVMLSRELPDGRVAVAGFLVDRYCLGVKDAFGEICRGTEYVGRFVEEVGRRMRGRDVAPADARKLLHEAVAYARGIGLAPHPDFAEAIVLFGDVNPADGTAEFEFGLDGKPCFFAGPNDTPGRCRQILSILNRTCGPGHFGFVTPRSESGSGADLLTCDDADELALENWYEDDEILDDL
jgi:hypothetical protein